MVRRRLSALVVVGIPLTLALSFLTYPGWTQNILPMFRDVPIAGSPYINPSIGGASTFTGFTTITVNCPNGSVNSA